MAAASTNGNGNGGDLPSGSAASSTHESAPGDSRSESSDASLDVLERGAALGRYLVLERLGAGAMGVVYAAYDPELDRKVAIKILRPQGGGDEERRRARLVREAKAIARVSHPNVVGIFDVGVHGGQVFLAMEYLAGGTLRDWLAARKRPWRDVVKMFGDVGRGLAGAHAEGMIHRDFKPDNVLIDKNGVPKVVDFGLVRLSETLESSTSGSFTDDDLATTETVLSGTPALAGLTRTGALTGTPAYMAPEQFLGKAVDARTDQFAFCVALHEALYGERPFPGETLIALADSVTEGKVRPAPKNTEVPQWIRTCLVRGLRPEPSDRFNDLADLVQVLSNDPIGRRNRRLLIGTTAVVVAASVAVPVYLYRQRRHEIDRQVAEHVSAADALLTDAAAKRNDSVRLRGLASFAFDNFDPAKGEDLWASSLSRSREADGAYRRGIQRLDAAVTLRPDRELKDRIADTLLDLIETDDPASGDRDTKLRQLALYDEGGVRAARLNANATLRIETTPPGLAGSLERYDPITFGVTQPAQSVGTTPLELRLEPGSYRLTFGDSRTHVGFRYPFVLAAGKQHSRSVVVPAQAAVPKGFVFVPEGRFLFGSANEELRSTFLGTAPLHEVDVPAFLISKHETTIKEWIDFLETLSPTQQQLRRPHGSYGDGGSIDIRKGSDDRWQLAFRATDKTYRATFGEPLRYGERPRRAVQDWARFPVAGISPDDALEYVAWLRQSGRVPGARLCTEREWEKAARGADGRDFPHGNHLSADDANIDITYARRSGAFGPDEVGSHPTSVSPFGAFDMSGNVWDVATSSLERDQFVIRGGSFYQNRTTALVANRAPISSVTRDQTIGLRVCADLSRNAKDTP